MTRQAKFSGDKLMALEILADKLEEGLAMEKMEIVDYNIEHKPNELRLSVTLLFSSTRLIEAPVVATSEAPIQSEVG